MIKWCDNLYMDNKVTKKKQKCIKALEEEKLALGLYCITLASNEDNLFDIISSNELLFKYYRTRDIYIIGLAFGRDSAIELVRLIIDDIYRETNDVKVKGYFSFQSKKAGKNC